MFIKSISFPTSLEDCVDITTENIDVFVKCEDGYTYTVVVATTKNIQYLMDQEKMNYFGPSHPLIIVKALTREIIEETIRDYAQTNDGYWLKLYHFATEIDKIVFDKLQAEHIEYLKELDELSNS